ncbi:MAG: hypothetical protein [Bacteriophage sp.]|nr:MAG: hypothetical protein [Bacteriophage sp.]
MRDTDISGEITKKKGKKVFGNIKKKI